MGEISIPAYNVAMKQWAARVLPAVDADVRLGKVTQATFGVGLRQEPKHWAGGNAVVYQVQAANGVRKAVRGFTSDKSIGEQDRLRAISRWISQNMPDYLVPFGFFPEGLRVHIEFPQSGLVPKVVPLVIMDWVDGSTLYEALEGYCRSKYQSRIAGIARGFAGLVAQMRSDGVAHGDLSATNVMVRPSDDRLCLVDYDDLLVPGMTVPDKVSGGQAHFQHRQKGERRSGPHMDAFSALSIHISLLALANDPSLFERHNVTKNLGDSALLFQDTDFEDPAHSEVFRSLRAIPDTHLQYALGELEKACAAQVNDVRFSDSIFKRDPARDLSQFVAAIATDDDSLILAAWRDTLENYAPAGAHYARVELARRRREQTSVLRAAIATGNDDAIAAAFTPELQGYSKLGLSGSEKFSIALARQRVSAFQRLVSFISGPHDERDILREYDKELAGYSGMTDAIRQAVKEAKRVENMPKAVRKAIRAGDESALLKVYDPALERPFYPFTDVQRAAITAAVSRRDALTAFLAAFVVDDEIKIVKAWNSILESDPAITKPQRDRLELARRQVNALNLLRQVLTSGGSDIQIVQAYNKILDQSRNLTSIERERVKDAFAAVRFATELSLAIKNEDDEKIAAVFNGRHFRLTSTISQDQFRRIWTAFEVVEKLARFRQAIRDGHDELIVSLASELPSNTRYPTQDELLVVAQAHERLQLQTEFRDALRRGDDDALVARFAPLLRTQASAFTTANRQWIEASQRRIMALRALRASLGSGDHNAVSGAVDRDSVLAMDLTPDERQSVSAARYGNWLVSEFKKAMGANRIEAMLKAYHPSLHTSAALTLPERQQLVRVQRALANAALIREAIPAGDLSAVRRASSPDLQPFLNALLSPSEIKAVQQVALTAVTI